MRPHGPRILPLLVALVAAGCDTPATAPSTDEASPAEPLRLIAGVVAPGDVLFHEGEVTDPTGDVRTFPSFPAPPEDLVFGRIVVDADGVHVDARTVSGGFTPVSEVSVALDLDQDPTTGQVRAGIGSEVVLVNGTSFDDPETVRALVFDPLTFGFEFVGAFPLERTDDGWRASVPRSLLGGDDGALDFRFESSEALSESSSTQWLDAMPDRPGVASTAPVTLEDALTGLGDAVDDLVDVGRLTPGQGVALRAKLAAAEASLVRGATTPACNQLEAYLNQVADFVAGGLLTPAEGRTLSETAIRLRDLIGC